MLLERSPTPEPQGRLWVTGSGEANVAWIEAESNRLMNLMGSKVGVTLPTGGEIVPDVYGHYPLIGWRSLVKEFFLPILTKNWKKRA